MWLHNQTENNPEIFDGLQVHSKNIDNGLCVLLLIIQPCTGIFSRLIKLNGYYRAGKTYRMNEILTTLVYKYGWKYNIYLKLSIAGKSACLSRKYTMHSHSFSIDFLQALKIRVELLG